MSGQPITLAGARLVARASGALWWPAERLLAVADLHLCRSERLARRGGALLPPYETAATLDRLAAEIAALAPARVVCLGDSFDDCAAGAALAAADAARLTALIAGRDWTWIAGNHDPAPLALPGSHRAELALGPLVFRHAGRPRRRPRRGLRPLAPEAAAAARGGAVSRPCFLADETAADPAGLRRLHRRPRRRPPGARRAARPRRARHPDRRAGGRRAARPGARRRR